MAEQEQNPTENATPFKLDEARQKGSVPKSIDVNTLMVLVAGAATLHFSGASIAAKEMQLFASIFSNAHQTSFALDDMAVMAVSALRDSLMLLAPLFLAITVVCILSNFLQTGPVFSLFPLKPDFDRVNPVSGFSRIFSVRLIFESIKTVLKFLILGAVLYYALRAAMPTLLRSMNVPSASLGKVLLPEAATILVKLSVALALITLLDAVHSRLDFAKRMRMSHREIKDEVKRREGDPRIKSRLRELQREAAKRARSLARVKDADVLITNPVHLAIAIKYDRDRLDAPLVLAKGAGILAARMRVIARRHHVPIVENRPLARALFHHVKIEHAVPAEHYAVLAKILVWVYALRNSHSPGLPA